VNRTVRRNRNVHMRSFVATTFALLYTPDLRFQSGDWDSTNKYEAIRTNLYTWSKDPQSKPISFSETPGLKTHHQEFPQTFTKPGILHHETYCANIVNVVNYSLRVRSSAAASSIPKRFRPDSIHFPFPLIICNQNIGHSVLTYDMQILTAYISSVFQSKAWTFKKQSSFMTDIMKLRYLYKTDMMKLRYL